jgi:hypothetical protein
MNVQVVARPGGTPLWFSRATPGRTHDLTAARAHGIVQVRLTRQILLSEPRTTLTANNPSSTSSSTATMPTSGHPMNEPSLSSKPGSYRGGVTHGMSHTRAVHTTTLKSL